MQSFSAKISKIGINPCVLVPAPVLSALFKEAGRDKGHIPVKGTVNGYSFVQTLVKCSSKWRLYINTPMLKGAGIAVNDKVSINIQLDTEERNTPMHPALQAALQKNKKAIDVFDRLPPSRQKEIKRYINHLKTDAAVQKNVQRAIDFLSGKERFIGRNKP